MPAALQSALIAALTAALVTYALEYAAKPTLEVRKARILEQHQAMRNIQSALKQLVMARRVMFLPEVIKSSPQKTSESLAACRSAVQQIHYEITRVRIESIPAEVQQVLARVTGEIDMLCSVGLEAIDAGRPSDAIARILAIGHEVDDSLTAVADYLLTPRTKPFGRIKHRRKVRALAKSQQELLAADDDCTQGE